MKKEISIWDKMAKSFHTTSSRSVAHRGKYETIADLALSVKPSSILDLGCGSGLLQKSFYEKGYVGKMLALDASHAMLDIANNIVDCESYVFKKKDIENDSWGKEHYDVIVSINLFFFLDNKISFLKKVEKHLKSPSSLFIMVTPKPEDSTSDWDFVQEHLRDTSFLEKIFIILNEIFNIPIYIRMAFTQRKISHMASSGIIDYETPQSIEMMAKSAKLDIISVENIHANQNWLFVMRRKASG